MNQKRLADGDMLSLLDLANQLHELPPNPVVRHEHMLSALCEMTGASAGISALLDVSPRRETSLLFLVYHGLDQDPHQTRLNQRLRSLDEPSTIGLRTLGQLMKVSRGVRLRDARPLCAALGLGASILSIHPLPDSSLLSLISLHRGCADQLRPFSTRARRVAQLFHSQIEWMFRWQPSVGPAAPGGLSPRQQETLRHLLAGDSEKQIAQKLARSRHTVHSHVKAIYRGLRVSSRGELLSLFVK